MHILLTGGGSGGHVVPLLAVAHELRKHYPDCTLSYIGEAGGKFGRLVEESDLFDNVCYVSAGKFRRYHDESLLQRLFDLKTNAKNFFDALKTLKGFIQSWSTIGKLKPNVMFAKGGFICVPVGVSAHLRRVPFVTHDSDAIPGLANRIIGRWAELHTTGLPADFYNYPPEKTVFVGVPASDEFREATKERIEEAKKALDIPKTSKVVVIAGGSQGSQRINNIVSKVVPQLLASYKNLYVMHPVGEGNEMLYGDYKNSRLIVSAFFNNFATIAATADVVITRAGANSMTEFGLLKKATIVIPSPFLTGGHQLENAKQLAQADAIIELDEQELLRDPNSLMVEVKNMLNSPKRRSELATNLSKATKPHAAKHIADILLEIVNETK